MADESYEPAKDPYPDVAQWYAALGELVASMASADFTMLRVLATLRGLDSGVDQGAELRALHSEKRPDWKAMLAEVQMLGSGLRVLGEATGDGLMSTIEDWWNDLRDAYPMRNRFVHDPWSLRPEKANGAGGDTFIVFRPNRLPPNVGAGNLAEMRQTASWYWQKVSEGEGMCRRLPLVA